MVDEAGGGLNLGTLSIGIAADNAAWLAKYHATAAQVSSLDARSPNVTMRGDSKPLINEVDKAEKRVGRFGAFARGIIGSVVGAFGVYQMGRMFKGFIMGASDAEETASKFGATFDEIKGTAEATAQTFASSFGMADTTAKQLLSDTGDLLSGFGYTDKASLDMSKSVNALAVDLASFTNYSGGAKGASAALTKALLGERESAKSLGISILEEDVKKQMAIDRTNGLTFATERQAKANATLAIAMAQSKNAIGDYARTAGGMANTFRRIGEWFKKIKELAGKLLVDVFDLPGKLRWIDKKLKSMIDNYAVWRDKILGVVVIAKKLWATWDVFWTNLFTAMFAGVDHFVTLFTWIKDNWGDLWTLGVRVFDAFVEDLQVNMTTLADVFTALFKGIMAGTARTASTMFTMFTTNIQGIWDFIRTRGKQYSFSIIDPEALAMQVATDFGNAFDGVDIKFQQTVTDAYDKNKIKGPEFVDFSAQYKSFTDAWGKIDDDAAALREKWAKENADAKDAGGGNDGGGDNSLAGAGKATAGALLRGSQEAYKAAMRQGMDPQVKIEQHTRESKEIQKQQLEEQKKARQAQQDQAPAVAVTF